MQHISKSFGRRPILVYACAAIFVLMCVFSADAETPPNKVDEQLKEISERIDRLEASKQPKMLAMHKDVDFLFEAVIGDIYDAADKEGFLKVSDNKPIKTIEIVYHWYRELAAVIGVDTDTVKLTFGDDKPTEVDNKNFTPMLIEAKMLAVEKVLNIKSESSDTLKKRIGRANEEINNKDWQNDDLRFGVSTSYLSDANAIATSVAVHSYFGYRRFTPGKWNLYNVGRRFSGFFAVGTGNAMDSSSGKSADIKGPVLSAGIGFDIVKGFALSAGVSIFSYKAPADQDYNLKNSATFGITLNSDLWRALFNDK